MNIIQLIRQEVKDSYAFMALLIFIIGIANSLLINTINSAAASIADPDVLLKDLYFILYVSCIVTFLATRKYVLNKSCFIMETVINQVRKRLANKIRLAELSTLENIGPAALYTCITQEALYISTVSPGMMGISQSLFTVVFMLLYLGFLSPYSFLLAITGILIGVYLYTRDFDAYSQNWKQMTDKERKFFDKFSNILDGFKEIRINRQKNEDVYESYTKVNDEKLVVRLQAAELFNKNMIIAQLSFYSIFGAIIFILPSFHPEHTEIIIKVVATVLFIIGPLESILNFIPIFSNADSAAENILDLEARLDKELVHSQSTLALTNKITPTQTAKFTNTMTLENITYQYDSDDPAYIFKIGPINLTFQKGEIIFVTGGNGSGKSTFLKVLTGLYMAQGGNIYLDRDIYKNKNGTSINLSNHQQYRNLYTTIFTDYHLFDKLYGLHDIDDAVVKQLLTDMELPEEKTTYKDGAFTNIRLSSGQKKRLALVNSILEDKDIYIYDEVAADLDPWFREVYYHKILSMLKSLNKTVFVVSHDKGFWQVADRILWMEKGQMMEVDKSK